MAGRGLPDRAAARWVADQLYAEFGRLPPAVAVEEAHLLDTGSGPVRVREFRDSTSVAPVVLLVHGGGYAVGSVDDLETVAMARSRVRGTGAVVLAVDYRLAPESPFPAAVDDVTGVVRHVLEHAAELRVDAAAIVLEGISSGAALVAAAALHHPPDVAALAGLVLEIPSLDLRPGAPWVAEFAAASGLMDRASVRDLYLQGADPGDPRASPAAGDLSRLPPTHVMTAECDPLRDVGEEFVRAARAAGASVSATRHLGAVHGSLNLAGVSRGARLWQAEVDAVVGELLAR